jgi:hypothetical protein
MDDLNGAGAYATALEFFGKPSVLLPIPKFQKGPKIANWQKLTFDQSSSPEHIKLLQISGNIGVLLGEPSGHLVDIDLDTEEAVKLFVKLNLHLVNKTLQTVGSRGRHFFFRIKGDYPKRVCRLEQPGDEHVGEWRGGTGQTVVAGHHPSGVPYRIVNPVPISEIEFSEITWPIMWAKPEIKEQSAEVLRIFENLRKGMLTSIELSELDVPIRTRLIGAWCKDGDLGFIYGERGCGKTWLAAAVACAVANGTELFEWEVPKERNVLWLDGEMPLADFKERVIGLLDAPRQNLVFIHHERFYDCGFGSLNLADPDTQQALTLACLALDTHLLLIDNLSCLFSGMLENDSDQWEMVLPWLLELRRMGVTVIIIHHAGRSGAMRGSSKREDSAAWIIKVEAVSDHGDDSEGAHFSSVFTKQRSGDHPESMREWKFKTDSDGIVQIACQGKGFDERVYELIKLGINTCGDIAQELGVSKFIVSRSAKRMMIRKLVRKKGRAYECVPLPGEK